MSARLPLADYQFISDFAAFCRTMGDEAYDYEDTQNCACAQFLKSRASNFGHTGGDGWFDTDFNGHPLPKGIGSATFNNGDWRFSALADRLEALIADAPALVGEPA